jgi:hypothetical protein
MVICTHSIRLSVAGAAVYPAVSQEGDLGATLLAAFLQLFRP